MILQIKNGMYVSHFEHVVNYDMSVRNKTPFEKKKNQYDPHNFVIDIDLTDPTMTSKVTVFEKQFNHKFTLSC